MAASATDRALLDSVFRNQRLGELAYNLFANLSVSSNVATFANGIAVTAGNVAVTAGTLTLSTGGATIAGTSYIGDTANANVTLGLTINQGAADNQIMALKSSDVAHTATTLAEADTYGAFEKNAATTGGLQITGFKDADGSVLGNALVLRGVLDETAADTTKSTAAVGIVNIVAGIEATNTIGAAGADENLLCVTDGAGATKAIIDAEGSLHGDAAATTYDDHDDLSLVRAYDIGKQGFVRNRWDDFVTANRANLEAIGIIGKTKGLDGERPLVNQTRLVQLHNGAINQLYSTIMDVVTAIASAKTLDEVRDKLPLQIKERVTAVIAAA